MSADKFFKGYKAGNSKVKKLETSVIEYQIKSFLKDNDIKVGFCQSDQETPSLYFSNGNLFQGPLSQTGKGVIYFGNKFVYAYFGNNSIISESDLKALIDKCKKPNTDVKFDIKTNVTVDKKKLDVLQVRAEGNFNLTTLTNTLTSMKGWAKI